MFGYVIPCKEKLNEAQWQSYRAAYCGLCHTLKARHGFLARFLLNYDFTFLALLLRRDEDAPCVRCRRCLASPFKGRNACEGDDAMDMAADISVLLVYWKLKDHLSDERGLRRIPAMAAMILFHRVFRKARQYNQPLYDEIGQQLNQLQRLEEENCPSLDRAAEQFARIMTAMVPDEWDESSRRGLEQLLYHLGRWIYLVDAWDDLDEDLKHRRYNPVACRFSLTQSDENRKQQAKESLERTIIHSENLAISAFHLGSYGYNSPVIENILCSGLQTVRHLVFSGQWKQQNRNKKQELSHL